jgi:hypothetical protein
MDKKPMIFNVMAWIKNDDGTFRLCVHHVAGFDSADAEQRIKEEGSQFLRGQLFINTDRFMEHHGTACRMYSTNYANEDNVSTSEYRKWVYRMLRDDEYDGDVMPAPYRRFHVKH